MYQPFAPIDFYDALALGHIPKYSRASAVGNNPDVDTATFPEDAWSGGGLYPWLPNGVNTALQIRSTSALDTMNVNTFGLTAPLYRQVTVASTLAGTTPVPLSTAITRINQVMPAAMNAGDIIIEDVAAPNTIRAIVPAGIGISQQAAFTVPEGCTLLIRQIYIGMLPASGASARQATVRTYFRFVSGATRLTVQLQMANGQSYAHSIEPPIALTVGTDFNLRIDNVSDNNSNVTCAWNGLLVQN